MRCGEGGLGGGGLGAVEDGKNGGIWWVRGRVVAELCVAAAGLWRSVAWRGLMVMWTRGGGDER